MRVAGLVVAFGLLAPAAFAQALVNDGKPMALQIQAKHANGLIVQLSGIQAGLSETVITAQLVNGNRKKIALAHTPRSTFLQTPDGQRYALSPPENNDRLEIEGRTKLEGELVFLGRLPEVDKVTLVINEDFGSTEEFANLPKLVIPIPLAAAAYTGESKKN
ncbi:MAG: hypothetical protein NZ555_06885 [Geminicoccaceae bacterium]|nr:hypothetical protein [Geminicoccaceae bacterium]MDW8370583.1 hypothetical protein [Geminicoccaceae bacterium]